MDSRIREALDAKAFDTIIRCRPARVIMYDDVLALLTAEPEPCASSNYSDIPNSSRLPEHYGAGDLVDDLREDERSTSGRMEAPREYVLSYPEACSLVNRYASQVADKRAEELRAQVKTLRESLTKIEQETWLDPKISRVIIRDLARETLAATEPKPSTKESV